jgi:hypothetical protein
VRGLLYTCCKSVVFLSFFHKLSGNGSHDPYNQMVNGISHILITNGISNMSFIFISSEIEIIHFTILLHIHNVKLFKLFEMM